MLVALYFHMIPMVGLQQMGLIGIFFQNGRSLRSIFDTSLVTVISAKPGSGVMVSAVAEIVHLQGVAPGEDAAAPASPRPQ